MTVKYLLNTEVSSSFSVVNCLVRMRVAVLVAPPMYEEIMQYHKERVDALPKLSSDVLASNFKRSRDSRRDFLLETSFSRTIEILLADGLSECKKVRRLARLPKANQPTSSGT